MDRLNFSAIIGAIAAFIASLLGGWDYTLQALMICMVVDYISGIVLAGVFQKSPKSKNGALESNAGFKGLWRKGMMLLIVLVGHTLDLVTELHIIRDCMIYGIMANEVISIIENAGLMGIPVPDVFKKAIDILNTKSQVNNK